MITREEKVRREEGEGGREEWEGGWMDKRDIVAV